MTKRNARQVSIKRDVASYEQHTVIEAAHTALSSEELLPHISNLPTHSAPRDNSANDGVSNVTQVLFTSSRLEWGDLVTLISIGVCIWFLIKLASPLLPR